MYVNTETDKSLFGVVLGLLIIDIVIPYTEGICVLYVSTCFHIVNAPY